MTKPISDKAEVALEYPDKLYIGTFERSSRFAASVDSTGIALVLERPGAEDVRKSVHMHINFGLFADILRELATTVGHIPKDDMLHHDQLAEAVTELHRALGGSMIGSGGAAGAATSAPALTTTGLDRLSPRERRIFEARLLADEPMSYEELATEFGVARARVKQLEDRVMEKLGANLQGPEMRNPDKSRKT